MSQLWATGAIGALHFIVAMDEDWRLPSATVGQLQSNPLGASSSQADPHGHEGRANPSGGLHTLLAFVKLPRRGQFGDICDKKKKEPMGRSESEEREGDSCFGLTVREGASPPEPFPPLPPPPRDELPHYEGAQDYGDWETEGDIDSSTQPPMKRRLLTSPRKDSQPWWKRVISSPARRIADNLANDSCNGPTCPARTSAGPYQTSGSTRSKRRQVSNPSEKKGQAKVFVQKRLTETG